MLFYYQLSQHNSYFEVIFEIGNFPMGSLNLFALENSKLTQKFKSTFRIMWKEIT